MTRVRLRERCRNVTSASTETLSQTSGVSADARRRTVEALPVLGLLELLIVFVTISNSAFTRAAISVVCFPPMSMRAN
jgi:hypothetical protein